MKLRAFLLVLLAMLMAGMATNASAHGSRMRLGVYVGGPVWGPVWYPPPYYYPPQVIVSPPPPQVYIEQAPEAAPDAGQQYWYFCKSAPGYYPYVKECPGGWQKVLPQPEN